MSKRIGITSILILILFAVSAQQKWNYVAVDKKSYELFQQNKWEELIDFNEQARKNGINYFYLNVRTGIAYYNLKKYRISSDWFLKAWKEDKSFEWLQEYLYYSLLYSGRTLESAKVSTNFTLQLKQKIGFKTTKPLRVAVEAGFCINPDFEDLTNSSHYLDADVGDNYGEAYYLKNFHFESFDFSHQLSPGFNLSHNFTYIGINREEQAFWGSLYSFPININQFQYYINPNFMLGKNIYISPSVNVIWGNSSFYLGDYNPNTFYIKNNKYSDIIFSTTAWTHFGNFSPGVELNVANINDSGFTQYSSWLTVYPSSNLNLYFTPRIYFKNDSENGFAYNSFGISGGTQVGPVHIYGQYLNGDMKNFIEAAGYVISNFPGKSSRKFSGSIYFPIGKKSQLVMRYINQDIIENYQVYTNAAPSSSIKYKFIKHTITAGISWNF